MKLVLNEQDVKRILLEEAQRLFPRAMFNQISIDIAYGQFRNAEIEHVEEEPSDVS